MYKDSVIDKESVDREFKNFIVKQNHPCIMARTVFKMDKYQLKVYDSMTSERVVQKILEDLNAYLQHYDFESNEFESIIACFPEDKFGSELEFETILWDLLQQLHDNDSEAWDTRVSKDPADTNFSFSLKGHAFFIIGMHPQSSRLARRSPFPTIVFNLHWQFEKLREMGAFKKVKKRIRQRDKKLQGSINPVLKDFGMDSEAKQYSGRNIDDSWKCPFHPKPNDS